VFTDKSLGRKRAIEIRRLSELGAGGKAEATEMWERVQAGGEAEAPQVRTPHSAASRRREVGELRPVAVSHHHPADARLWGYGRHQRHPASSRRHPASS
jgi:hypothetical protein